MKKLLMLSLALIMVMAMAVSAQAFNAVNIGTDTTSYSVTPSGTYPSFVLDENYNGQNLVNGQVLGTDFFDKLLTFVAPQEIGDITLTFNITNGIANGQNGKFTWTDFHLILDNDGQILNSVTQQ